MDRINLELNTIEKSSTSLFVSINSAVKVNEMITSNLRYIDKTLGMDLTFRRNLFCPVCLL